MSAMLLRLSFHDALQVERILRAVIDPEEPDPCGNCRGQGEIDCQKCKGAGEKAETCDMDHKHWRRCGDCEGDGRIMCPKCDGLESSSRDALRSDDEGELESVLLKLERDTSSNDRTIALSYEERAALERLCGRFTFPSLSLVDQLRPPVNFEKVA